MRSDAQPKAIAPTMSPPKNTELMRPAWVEVRSNSSVMAGSTAGRIPPSTEVMRMAPVVIAKVHHDIAWPRGRHESAPGFIASSTPADVELCFGSCFSGATAAPRQVASVTINGFTVSAA